MNSALLKVCDKESKVTLTKNNWDGKGGKDKMCDIHEPGNNLTPEEDMVGLRWDTYRWDTCERVTVV
jgi:hypothetical protein